MTNEEIIEELLHEASELGLRTEVIDFCKRLMESNPKMDRLTALELSLNHIKNSL